MSGFALFLRNRYQQEEGGEKYDEKAHVFYYGFDPYVAMCASAFAVEPRANRISPSLEFDGTTANCKVVIISSGDDIDATMELWRGSTLVGSWPGEGTSYVSISGKCNVTKGITYTLKVSGTIGGERIDYDGISRTC